MNAESGVTRREVFVAMGSCVAISGCTGEKSKQSGSVIDSIELLNVDETDHRFRITLLAAGETQIYETAVTVDGAPGNAYTRTVLKELPSTPTTTIVAATAERSTEKSVADSLDAPVFTVLCNPDGDVGITRFTETIIYRTDR